MVSVFPLVNILQQLTIPQDLCELLLLKEAGPLLTHHRMGSVNLVVIVESMRSIIDHGSGELNEFHLPSLIAVGAALGQPYSSPYEMIFSEFRIGVKLLLFLYCLGLRKSSSQVHVLWEDHRNDLFINGFGQWLFLPVSLAWHKS